MLTELQPSTVESDEFLKFEDMKPISDEDIMELCTFKCCSNNCILKMSPNFPDLSSGFNIIKKCRIQVMSRSSIGKQNLIRQILYGN